MFKDGLLFLLLFILGVTYGILVALDYKIDSDRDEVLEAKCKKCICYDGCPRRGRDYNCHDYMTEEMLQKRGIEK